MVELQRHRGPDGDGFLVDGPLAFGMRRLSIIDLAGGDQPIFSEDRSLAVVFNGEIYNYIELRKDLLARGHCFSTRSDTEVLVHLYEEYGCDMLAKLNGMFAFAIWDRKAQNLLLVRDRMGVKPLYYARTGSRWLFASELKSLLTEPALDTRLDQDAIADYLRLGYIPREATPYVGVRRLLPGHYLRIQADRFDVRRWWDLAEDGEVDPRADPETLARDIGAKFDDAVRLRMRSDVPVASFLSGGLDSSLVTITAQRESAIPIHTFTLGFEHAEFDEMPYARAVAAQSETDHLEMWARIEDASAHLPLLLWHMDEPMGDSSIIPNYLISRLAAKHGKVCLSGLGGDELFGGYSRYVDPEMGRIRKMLGSFPSVARRLAPMVSSWHHGWSEQLRLAGDAHLDWLSYFHRLQIFNTRDLEDIGFPALGRAEETIESLWRRYPGTDPVSRRQFVDQQTYLPDQILAITDRMSMANSLEVRTPFMDYRLVHLSQKITGSWKQSAGEFKILLKKSLGARCPAEVVNRPKWGFDTPLRFWVKQPEIFEIIHQLPEGIAAQQGLFRAEGIRRMVETPEIASRFARRVWALLVLEVWLHVRDRREPPQERLHELLEVYA